MNQKEELKELNLKIKELQKKKDIEEEDEEDEEDEDDRLICLQLSTA